MKVLTWHGKYDLRCESVPDPEIKAMMDGDGDIVSGWQNKLRGDLEHHACGIGRRAASQDGRARLRPEEVTLDPGGKAMTRTVFRLLAASALPLALGAATVAPAMATDPPAKQAAAPAMATPSTSTFLTNTAVANLFEIESSKVALTKTKNDKIKAFANQMVTDHTGAGTKFKQAVTEAKLTPPAEKLDAKHQTLLGDLQKKDGTAFDAAYVKAQSDGHVETVAMFEAYAKGGDNARMKQFANDMLPTLKAHLDQVSKLK